MIPWRTLVAPLAALAAMTAVGACGGGVTSHASRSSSVGADTWTPPAISGPPSTAKFCTLLVAGYQHLGQIPNAVSNKVRQDIVADFIAVVPKVIAAAPAEIAGPAAIYLRSVAQILSDLDRVGLNAQKLAPGQLSPLLLDPTIKAAGTKVIAYSQANCHYTIGG